MAIAQSLSIQKSFGNVALAIIPDQVHEFILSTAEVARGYGATINAIHKCKQRHSDEIIENTHFLSRLTKCQSRENLQTKQIFWTKRGVVKLGFFVKSDVAKDFRTWAENLIVNSSQPKPTITPKVPATYSTYWESTGKVGVFIYKRGVSNALLLPCSRFRNPDEFATEEGIANILKEDIARFQFLLDTKSWLNAFDGYGIKILPDGQKVYSTVVFGEYAALTNKKIRGE